MSKVTLKTPFAWCETEFSIEMAEEHRIGYDATISIHTGAAHLMTYATRDDLRALAARLLEVAEAK